MASARALRAGKAIIELSLLTGDVDKELKRIQTRMKNFGKAISGYGQMGVAIGGAITGPLLAATKLAADAQEELSKFKAVFGDQTVAANEFAEALAGSIGRSATDIRSGMNAFQGFFVGLGFGSDEARKLTEQMQTLSHDFAAFHNISDQEAMERFISALSGSSEVLDKFGVNTRQAALEQVLMAKGIKKSWTAVTEMEKSTARLDVIMKAMTDQGAVGAAVRESGSFANQLKKLQGAMKDVGITIGSVTLAPLTRFLDGMNGVTKSLGEWISQSPVMIQGVERIVVSLGVAGGAAVALGFALNTVVAHPVVAGLTAIVAIAGDLAIKFNEAEKAAKTMATEGIKAFEQLTEAQLEQVKSDLEWRVFFEKLDFRQLHDEELAGRRSEAERALAGINNRIEELQAGRIQQAAVEDAKAKSSHHPSVPFVNQPSLPSSETASTRGFNPFNRGFQAIGDAAQAAAYQVIRGASRFNEALEKQLEIGDTLQGLEDETQRARIALMEDGIAKEKALLAQEHAERLRDLEKNGLLNEGTRAALDKLMGLQGQGLKGLGNDRVMQSVGVMDARNSRQMFGGRQVDEQTKLQRQMVQKLDAIKNKPGGVPVIP